MRTAASENLSGAAISIFRGYFRNAVVAYQRSTKYVFLKHLPNS